MKIYRKEELPEKDSIPYSRDVFAIDEDKEIYIVCYSFSIKEWFFSDDGGTVYEDFVWCYPPEELKYTKKETCNHDCEHISQGVHKPVYCSNCGEEL